MAFIQIDKKPITSFDPSDRKRIKGFQRELARKEKALAETAVLLVLKKSSLPTSIWMRSNGSIEDHKKVVVDTLKAIKSGALKMRACATIGLNMRTFQRWSDGSIVQPDQRPIVERPVLKYKFSAMEREAILDCCNRPVNASVLPCQIIPSLADDGLFIGSEFSFYRILNAEKYLLHTGRSKPKKASKKPTSFIATGAN